MLDRANVIKGLECCSVSEGHCEKCPYETEGYVSECTSALARDAIALLKEQDERLCKLQKDKDKLCLEVSEWKHKFHDAPPKFVSQGVVDQICWERDVALSQLEQIGKGLGSKMDDIVAMLKEQEAVKPVRDKQTGRMWLCGNCGSYVGFEDHDPNDPNEFDKYCRECGKPVLWKGR